MNLSLRAAGRLACEKASLDVLKILSDLLECDNLQVRFYTNGTLYSVLARPALRERAREMGMEDILKYLIQSSDENFANQIEYILKQLAREDNDENSDSDNEDEEDEDDDELGMHFKCVSALINDYVQLEMKKRPQKCYQMTANLPARYLPY